jgi:hypothetical protein
LSDHICEYIGIETHSIYSTPANTYYLTTL